jgi:hypothetical protein
MQLIGCDLHARQQTLALLDTETGEFEERVLEHGGDKVREFYRNLPRPARVGPKRPARCSGSWSWKSWVSSARSGTRHDALLLLLLLRLLSEDRFPSIWMPSLEQRDVRALVTAIRLFPTVGL